MKSGVPTSELAKILGAWVPGTPYKRHYRPVHFGRRRAVTSLVVRCRISAQQTNAMQNTPFKYVTKTREILQN